MVILRFDYVRFMHYYSGKHSDHGTYKMIKTTITLICSFVGLSLSLIAQDTSSVHYTTDYHFIASKNTRKIRFQCLIPTDIEHLQKVKTVEFSQKPNKVYSKNGNRYAVFILDSVLDMNTITVYIEIDLYRYNFRKAKGRNHDYANPKEDFLHAERYIESNDSLIMSLAQSLKGKTELGTIRKIYHYAANRIKYTDHMNTSLGARLACVTGKGDCTEYADLMIALCRAIGIPARRACGIVVGFNNSPFHAWTEIWGDKYGWMRIDPTYGKQLKYKSMLDRYYIQLSTIRNDREINNSNFWTYRFWGGQVKVTQALTLHKNGELIEGFNKYMRSF